MSSAWFDIHQVSSDEAIHDEELGTKPKFWIERDGECWLCKEARENTGEDWSEKLAYEFARLLGIPAAHVELAIDDLIHGNEILAGQVLGYDTEKRFGQSDHTIDNIQKAVAKMFSPELRLGVLKRIASYLLLDALIINTDRHHENWGIVARLIVDAGRIQAVEVDVAPTFDHASSMGRELLDERIRRFLAEPGALERYIRKGKGATMQSGNMKTLFLAWQAPDRAWYPVGRLVADPVREQYQFDYTKGALEARDRVGFSPLFAFPDFNQTYTASELFPLFKNRIMSTGRKDFKDYLSSLDLDPNNPDLIEVLAVTGGERQTDSLEVFPKIKKQLDGTFHCRFFLHGTRHVHPAGMERAKQLTVGEPLSVLLETTNPATGVALLLGSQDYPPVGWAPRYLVSDLLRAMSVASKPTAKVVRVNEPSTPINRRYLVELSGTLPEDMEPMSDDRFQPIH